MNDYYDNEESFKKLFNAIKNIKEQKETLSNGMTASVISDGCIMLASPAIEFCDCDEDHINEDYICIERTDMFLVGKMYNEAGKKVAVNVYVGDRLMDTFDGKKEAFNFVKELRKILK